MLSDELRKSVLQAAVEGKLVPQNREDEPASILLKKIGEEKEKLIGDRKAKDENLMEPISEDEVAYDLPRGWEWVRLGNIAQINPKNDLQDELEVSFIPMKLIDDGFNNKHIFEVKKWRNIKSGYTHFQDNDVVVAKITPCFENRKSAVMKKLKNGYGAGTTELYVIRSYGNLILPEYLLYYFKTNAFIVGGVNTFTGTAGQQRVSKSYFENVPIAIPPHAEQKRIVEKIEEILSQIDDFEETEKELDLIKSVFPEDMTKSLLHAAFQGKLTEQYSTDSSIDELLEEIKKEKEQLIKDKKFNGRKSFGPISEDEIPFDIPENWRWLRLVDCANMYTGNSIPEATKKAKYMGLSEGYNYIATKDVGFDYVIDYDNGVKIPKDEPKFKYAYKDASLLCIEGGSAGRKIGYLEETVCFGNKLCAFHPIVINSKYLYYYLQSPTFTDIFKDNITGIIGGVGINKLRSMIIPIPSLEEQERIVDKLEQLLPLCEDLVE